MAESAKGAGISLTGLAVFCVLAGAVFLGVVYPIYRMVHPARGAPSVHVAKGTAGDSLAAYAFGPGWTCASPNSGKGVSGGPCWRAPVGQEGAGAH